MRDDELNFLLSVDPDVAAVEKALAAMGKDIDTLGAKASRTLAEAVGKGVADYGRMGGGAGGIGGLEPLRHAATVAVEKSVWEALAGMGEHRGLGGMEQVAREYRAPGQGFDATRGVAESMDPTDVHNRVRRRRAVAEAQRAVQEADWAEDVRQEGGPVKAVGKRMLGGGEGSAHAAQAALGGGALPHIGEMLGMAAGGPVGAVLGKYIGEVLPKAIAAPAALATGALKTLGSSLSGLQGTLGPISVGFDLASKSISAISEGVKSIPVVGELLGGVFRALEVVPDTIKHIMETLTIFASKAFPSQFHLLQIAVEDVQAVIGQAFIPVVELMKNGIRAFGDALATILPSTADVDLALGYLKEAFGGLGETVQETLRTIGPLIKDVLIYALTTVANVLGFVVKGLNALVYVLTALLKPIAMLLGYESGTIRSSWGASAQPTKISGLDEYTRQLQLAAYRIGTGPTTADVPRSVVGIHEMVGNLLAHVLTFTPAGLAEELALAIIAVITGTGDQHGASAAVAAATGQVTSSVAGQITRIAAIMAGS